MTIDVNIIDSKESRQEIKEMLELLSGENKHIRELLFLILKKLDKMGTQQDQIQADLDAIKQSAADLADAQAQEATNLGVLADEVKAIQQEEATGADQSTTVAALDSLAGKLATAASNAKSNAAALAALVTSAAPAPAVPATSDHAFTGVNGEAIVVNGKDAVPAVGDKVTVNGAAFTGTSNTDFTLADGSVLTVAPDSTVAGFTAAPAAQTGG